MDALDLLVLSLYFVISLAIGLYFGRGEKSTHDFFLGGRRQHWLLATVSIIATEVSAMTLIGVPADAFRSDWTYLQAYAGSFVGRILIVYLLLPAFYGGAVTTVYEYLGQRFGPWTRTTASLLFFVSRILGSGIRLLVASLALAEVFGWNLGVVVVGSTVVAIVYTAFGGIKAILWTDLFQAVVFLGAGVVTVVLLFQAIPASWTENLSAVWHSGKMNITTWSGGWNHERLFWLLALSTVFTTMAAMGTDQDLTQRMLTCPDLRRAQRSLLVNAFVTFPIPCLYLLIGTLLHQYYAGASGAELPQRIQEQTDRVYPYYIATAVPSGWGLRGLLVAAIFAAAMSSLASTLGALSATAVTDLYRPLRQKESETHYLRVARAAAVLFGIVLITVALAFEDQDRLLWIVLKLAGIVFGGLLGIFLLGVLTRDRGQDRINVAVMLSSVALLTTIMALQEFEMPGEFGNGVRRWYRDQVFIAWPWWIILGTVWTFFLAALARTNVAHRLPCATAR